MPSGRITRPSTLRRRGWVGVMIVAAALLALVAPAAAAATPFVPQALRDAATAHPTHEFRVIVQAQPGIPVLRLRAGVRSELNDEQSADNRLIRPSAHYAGPPPPEPVPDPA